MKNNTKNEPHVKGKAGRLVIAGPCSAESPRQLMDTARVLAASGHVDFFRAGAWKPRTSPGSFQGVGSRALKWLQDVRQETGLAVCTEVGSVQHAIESLEHGLDMVWIGARTVSNPFVVQEIADVLKGSGIHVMVKNPMAPDLDLWAGSIQRFRQSGTEKVWAIHRGFFYWAHSVFRNHPWWHLPMELKERMPDLPIICDPSHIAGDRRLVPMLVQRALEMAFDGLMIEVHPDPDKALSDARQQLTPDAFLNMMRQNSRRRKSGKQKQSRVLDELRAEIDGVDQLLVWALSKRMKLSGEIASIKSKHQMGLHQPGRWEQVIRKVTSLGTEGGLRSDFITKLFEDIHHESLSVQKLQKPESKISGNRPNFVR